MGQHGLSAQKLYLLAHHTHTLISKGKEESELPSAFRPLCMLDKLIRGCKHLAQVQRRRALRVTSVYRTVSQPAVMVITGVILVTLLAKERKII